MHCKDIQSCIAEINSYCRAKPIGKALLINVENYDAYQGLRSIIEADNTKNCIYVSNYTPANGLPDIDQIMDLITKTDCYALFGLSQTIMLRGAEYVDQTMGRLLELPIHGHAIVFLDHCEQFLSKYFHTHPDNQKRIILVDGNTSSLPKIRLASKREDCIGYTPFPDMKHLLAYLELMNNVAMEKRPEVTVISRFGPALFSQSIYSVKPCDGIYETLAKYYAEISSGTEKCFGTEEQWRFLADKISISKSLPGVAKMLFGSAENLSSYIGEVFEENDDNKKWFLWLYLKVFPGNINRYLSFVLKSSRTVEDFLYHVYMDLLQFPIAKPEFKQLYIERKRLIDSLPEDLYLLDEYCAKTGICRKDAVYYLTNASEKEELAFMRCMETYDYTEEELFRITADTFPALHAYLKHFSFNATNTKLPASDVGLRTVLTEYFYQYKLQKITNRIYPDFMAKVERFAEERPYNKLQTRSSIVSKMDRSKSQLYFFDALGVEYLAYIQEKCEQYGLIAEIAIAHCELPSITSKNKEFIHYFPGGAKDIKELDELKHHSQIIDYEQCKEPVHLFRELQIIDEELKKILSQLKQGNIDKAVIISDHGASRLAVIREQENELLELEEKGIHSGRCCPAKEDPHIKYASYWDGFAVLANYDRFKGGRRANVEVHGGASLEEILVPVISLTKKPADIDICFVDSTIKLKAGKPASIIIFSNIPLNDPKLLVNGKMYKGEFCEDSKHAQFVMPELKRTKDWIADFYDGDKKLATGLEFHTQKGTQEQTLFKKKLF